MGKRIAIGIVLLVLFVGVLILGRVAQLALFTIAAAIAAYEMLRAFREKGYAGWSIPPFLAALLSAPVMAAINFGAGADAGGGWLPVLCLWMVCVLLCMLERVFNAKRSTEGVLASIWVLVYPLAFFLPLLALCFLQDSTLAILAAFACPLLGDTLAYFVGSAIGKKKLCPEISPKKTVAGSVASLGGSVGAGLLLFVLQGALGTTGARLLPLLVLGLVCGVLGQAGDLFASVVKRWAGIKDYGTLLPGHGGVMDRLDSVLFCAPVVYACFVYFV